MELVERIGGFGIFQTTATETELLTEIRKLAENQHKSVPRYLGHIKRYETNYVLGYTTLGQTKIKETQMFVSLVRTLFPTFAIDTRETADVQYFKAYAHDKIKYVNVAGGKTVEVTPHYTDQRVRKEPICLEILFSEDCQYNIFPITVALPVGYVPNSVDDVVELLGRKEEPVLAPASLITIEHGYVHTIDQGYVQSNSYGLADVDRLERILHLYHRASEMIEKCSETIGITKPELEILRRDTLKHENLVIRDLSRDRYQAELQRLVTH